MKKSIPGVEGIREFEMNFIPLISMLIQLLPLVIVLHNETVDILEIIRSLEMRIFEYNFVFIAKSFVL